MYRRGCYFEKPDVEHKTRSLYFFNRVGEGRVRGVKQVIKLVRNND